MTVSSTKTVRTTLLTRVAAIVMTSGEDAPGQQVRAEALVQLLAGSGQIGVTREVPERDPERAERAECGRTERVALGELPDAGGELGDAAVGESHAEHDRLDRGVQDVGVDETEQEGGEPESGQSERAGIGDVCTRYPGFGSDRRHDLSCGVVGTLEGACVASLGLGALPSEGLARADL